jgi:hypothetical protein
MGQFDSDAEATKIIDWCKQVKNEKPGDSTYEQKIANELWPFDGSQLLQVNSSLAKISSYPHTNVKISQDAVRTTVACNRGFGSSDFENEVIDLTTGIVTRHSVAVQLPGVPEPNEDETLQLKKKTP